MQGGPVSVTFACSGAAALTRDGWRSAATAGGCCTPSGATRWSPSDRRSRGSRPASRCRRCSSGTARRSRPRSRPTCWPRAPMPSPGRRRGARVRSVRARWDGRHTPGRRFTAPARGTARSRWRGGSPRPASSTSEASRAATSGRSRPSSGSPRSCSPPPAPEPGWTTSSGGPMARARASWTRRSPS